MIAYSAAALSTMAWVLRKRQPVPLRPAGTIGVLAMILITIARANLDPDHVRSDPNFSPPDIPEAFVPLAASLSDGGAVVIMIEGGDVVETIVSAANPFPGEPVAVMAGDLSMPLEMSGWAHSSAADGHQTIEFKIRHAEASELPRRVTGRIPMIFFKPGERHVIPPTGGRIDLPGSHTEFDPVQFSRSGNGGHRSVFEVATRTTLFGGTHWLSYFLRERSRGKFDPVGEETVGRIFLPGEDLIELRHRKTGDTLRLDDFDRDPFERGRASEVWHLNGVARGFESDPEQADTLTREWLSEADLVVQKRFLIGTATVPFAKTFIPMRSLPEEAQDK